MKRSVWKRRVERHMLHYGISFVLVVLAAIVFCILYVMKMNEKVSVEIMRTPLCYQIYVPKGIPVTDTLHIDLDNGVQLAFCMLSHREEPDYDVFLLRPCNEQIAAESFEGNTLLHGNLFTKKVRLIQLVFRRKQS